MKVYLRAEGEPYGHYIGDLDLEDIESDLTMLCARIGDSGVCFDGEDDPRHSLSWRFILTDQMAAAEVIAETPREEE